jgi:hypothetical protein
MTLPIAFVLLQEPAAPDLSALLEAMRQRHPERSWTEGSPGPSRPRSPFILCGKRIVVLMPVQAPLPDDEEMWARAATAWPEAREVAARHRAHVIVSLMGESEGKIEDAKIVTAVVGGLIAITAAACGVVFGGRVVRSSQTWLDLSARAFAPYPDYPYALWIDVASFRLSPARSPLGLPGSLVARSSSKYPACPARRCFSALPPLPVTCSNMVIRSTTATPSETRRRSGSA